MLIIFAVGVVVPPILRVTDLIRERGYSLFDVTSPFQTLDRLDGSFAYVNPVLLILSAAALLCVLINLRAMQRGIAELVFSELNPAEPEPNRWQEVRGQTSEDRKATN